MIHSLNASRQLQVENIPGAVWKVISIYQQVIAKKLPTSGLVYDEMVNVIRHLLKTPRQISNYFPLVRW